jgi:GTP-binding protein
MEQSKIRNLAIIAHVDHGKTTLVDAMLKRGGIFHQHQQVADRIMDRGDLERERGITIMSKNTSIIYNGYKLNIVDTPGHADFGSEVERICQMVDGVLLLVDAFEGPMPQTRFVLRKALAADLVPIVVINKIDRPNARPAEVLDQVLDLFIDLGASEEQLDFPVIYAEAKAGKAMLDLAQSKDNLDDLFSIIIERIPSPGGDPNSPLQMAVAMLEYDPYVGRQAIGRISNGQLGDRDEVLMVLPDGTHKKGKIATLSNYQGLKKEPICRARAGEIVVVSGLDDVPVGATLSDPDHPRALPFVQIDQPTISMVFSASKSPFAGREGQFVTSRNLKERLERELEDNVGLKVEPTDSPDAFVVSGRGELHLSILIETMRREGYEFEAARPQVILQEINGVLSEPFEELVVDVPSEFAGAVMELLGPRHSQLNKMDPRADGHTILEFFVPTRGLFGLRAELLTSTRGQGVTYHAFHHWGPVVGEIATRLRGSLVAFETGTTTSYALENAQLRGELFVGPGVEVYRGMVVGENARPGDLRINVCKRKQMSNMRSSTSEISVKLVPPRDMTLEQLLEFLAEDELLEITPDSLRVRKRELT